MVWVHLTEVNPNRDVITMNILTISVGILEQQISEMAICQPSCTFYCNPCD